MKTTPLYPWHSQHAAKMGEFAGYALPLWYQSALSEHQAVREKAGLFDVSHMGEFRIEGQEALAFLEWATPNRVAALKPGRGHYSMLLNSKGGVVDDIYIFRRGESYQMVVNAARREADWEHLNSLAPDFAVTLQDVSDSRALLALQGPDSARILASLSPLNPASFRKNSLAESEILGVAAGISRTGYTGADGFELTVPPAAALTVWEGLVAAGAAPAGLAARDSLRLEAGYALYGHELDESTSPLCTPYAWVIKEKDFLGRTALDSTCPQKLVGIQLSKGIPRAGMAVTVGEKTVGQVSSGGFAPSLGYGVALAWLEAEYCDLGTSLTVAGKPGQVVALPFYGGKNEI